MHIKWDLFLNFSLLVTDVMREVLGLPLPALLSCSQLLLEKGSDLGLFFKMGLFDSFN